MLPKFPAVYVYDIKSHTMSQYFNMTKDVIEFNHSSNRHTYACDFVKRIRIEVNPAYEKIFHASGSSTYSVCLNNPNQDRAVELLTDYILKHIHERADYHQNKVNEYTNLYIEVSDFRNNNLPSDNS